MMQEGVHGMRGLSMADMRTERALRAQPILSDDGQVHGCCNHPRLIVGQCKRTLVDRSN